MKRFLVCLSDEKLIPYNLIEFNGDLSGLKPNLPFGTWDGENKKLVLNGSEQVLYAKRNLANAKKTTAPSDHVHVLVRRVVDRKTNEIRFVVFGVVESDNIFAMSGKA